MQTIIVILIAGVFNRIRGTSIKFHSELNIIAFGVTFGILFGLEWWGYILMSIGMWAGSSTGWSEGISGCFNDFNLDPSLYNWISKIVKPINQWTTFLYMCIRALIWVACIEFSLLVVGEFSFFLLLAIPLFYLSYRVANYIPVKDRWALGEVIYGAILWYLTF